MFDFNFDCYVLFASDYAFAERCARLRRRHVRHAAAAAARRCGAAPGQPPALRASVLPVPAMGGTPSMAGPGTLGGTDEGQNVGKKMKNESLKMFKIV